MEGLANFATTGGEIRKGYKQGHRLAHDTEVVDLGYPRRPRRPLQAAI